MRSGGTCRCDSNSLRSDVVGPGEDQRDRKTDQQQHDDQTQLQLGKSHAGKMAEPI